jgi:hypothetical protein
MKKSIVLMMMIAGLVPSLAQAQLISKKGTASAQFLLIPVGSRAAGLGGAVTATVSDASAMYWNPGALASVRTRQALIEHSGWIGDLQHNYVAVALPVSGAGTFGLSLTALTMADMEETTFEQQEGTGRMFGASSYAVGVSYGQYLLRTFAIGGTVKWVTERIFNTSASAVAVDIGTQYQTPFKPLRFGVRIANFGPKMHMQGDDLIAPVDIDLNNNGNNSEIDAYLKTKRYALPLMLQAGLALDALSNERIRATLLLDATSPSDNNQSLNVGTELSFFNGMFSVQAGLPELGLKDRTWEYAAGGSVNYRTSNGVGLGVGYAAQGHKYLGLTNRISMTLNF